MGLDDPPTGVKQARAALRRHGLLAGDADASESPPNPLERDAPECTQPVDRLANASASDSATNPGEGGDGSTRIARRWGRRGERIAALELRKLWFEIPRGPSILRGVDLVVAPGESIAVMGCNGAGKSTLLRHAAGLLSPTRGEVRSCGRVALLLQNPGDYFLHERVCEELSPDALRAAGLEQLAERNPRDLSGGERQRLALAIVAGEGEPPAVLALDEPTRGMDRESKAELAAELCRRSQSGQAVIVATHDPEFAATFGRRVVLLGDGCVVADGLAPRAARGRVVLRDRDSPHPRRRLRGIAARAGRSAPAKGGAGHMSWPVALFAIVLGVLIAGWVAYERSRPSARMVAVVGPVWSCGGASWLAKDRSHCWYSSAGAPDAGEARRLARSAGILIGVMLDPVESESAGP